MDFYHHWVGLVDFTLDYHHLHLDGFLPALGWLAGFLPPLGWLGGFLPALGWFAGFFTTTGMVWWIIT